MTTTNGTARHRTPDASALQESLTMMFGCPVTVADDGGSPPPGAIPVAVGPYVDDSDELCGCSWVDLPLGAAMGAALAMSSESRVTDCVLAGVLGGEFRDNLGEVLNIVSALLNDDDVPHVRIRTLETLEAGLTDDVLDLLADPRTGRYYTVGIDGYGSGLFSFTLA